MHKTLINLILCVLCRKNWSTAYFTCLNIKLTNWILYVFFMIKKLINWICHTLYVLNTDQLNTLRFNHKKTHLLNTSQLLRIKNDQLNTLCFCAKKISTAYITFFMQKKPINWILYVLCIKTDQLNTLLCLCIKQPINWILYDFFIKNWSAEYIIHVFMHKQRINLILHVFYS